MRGAIPIDLQVDKQSPIPIRRQLTEQLKHVIEAGGVPSDQPQSGSPVLGTTRRCWTGEQKHGVVQAYHW